MKFKIKTEIFLNAVTPAADIALKNTIKGFRHAKNITIKAYSKDLHVIACGGTAGITVKVAKADGYIFIENGAITVRAKELQSALKSFSSSGNLLVTVEDCYVKITLESKEYTSIPASTELIKFPDKSCKFKQQVTVDRKYFLKGLNLIKFAPAIEERMFSYMCIAFESWRNRIRFISGTGGRFAVIEYNGDKHTKKV